MLRRVHPGGRWRPVALDSRVSSARLTTRYPVRRAWRPAGRGRRPGTTPGCRTPRRLPRRRAARPTPVRPGEPHPRPLSPAGTLPPLGLPVEGRCRVSGGVAADRSSARTGASARPRERSLWPNRGATPRGHRRGVGGRRSCSGTRRTARRCCQCDRSHTNKRTPSGGRWSRLTYRRQSLCPRAAERSWCRTC